VLRHNNHYKDFPLLPCMIGDRPIEEKTKGGIERAIEGMGEFVQMSYLQRALKSGLDFDTRKFVLLRLGGIYEGKGMFLEAAKMIKSAAEINTTYKDKSRDFMKAVELYIKGGNYLEADNVFRLALALGNSKEKREMKSNLKNYYLNQAIIYVNSDRRSLARAVFERMLSLDLELGERGEIERQLLDLYDKLGDVQAYFNLKRKS
jgi:tetratricopeptide (TPR) repeat protein